MDPAAVGARDEVVRAMTTDGAFRVIAAVTTETVRGALAAQATSDELALRLGELITGAVLLRETTQPARRVQLLWKDRRGGTLVADALPDGNNRGIVNPGDRTDVLPDGNHLLQVHYTLPNAAMHQGVVAIPAGEDMSSALMRYLHQSEQILSMTGVAALPGPGGVRAAGGYVIQLLPEATREVIDDMTDHVGGLPPVSTLLEGRATARSLIAALMGKADFEELASSSLQFGCTCSDHRVMSSILTLPPDEVTSILASHDPLDVRCDACGRSYRIPIPTLRAHRDSRHN